MSFESGKKYGFIGSLINVIMPIILVVLLVVLILAPLFSYPATPAPFVFSLLWIILFAAVGILGLVGIILFIVGMHRLSQYYSEPGIFKNALYGLILNIIGTVAGYAIEIAFLAFTLGSISPVNTTIPSGPSFFLQLIGTILALFAVIFVFAIISAIFYMRAFNKLGEKSGVGNFKTTGLLYLVGTVLTIVAVGGILVWVAWIFSALGFNSLKPASTHAFAPSTPTTSPPSIAQKRFCPYCGTENEVGAVFCRRCGRQL